ncbi:MULTISPECIES: glycosyltransferase family 2 protein [Proteus]|uniref:glycosyltransferase family 2 protein n=1 Tax=Proteus TaxID=583 RepID=UPI001C603827|nr:glycosyltransferase family 2 protein [Proteus terrae]
MKKDIVSVAVISYNSEATILETLNSILHQDYDSQYIELILGDDGSKDNTQNIINDWVIINENKFYKVILNINNINRGIVANFNSTCQLATSDWIKPIAADDILMKNCISELYNFVTSDKSIKCSFCKVEKFNTHKSLGVIPKDSYYFTLSAEKQFKTLLIDNFLPAPGCFIMLSLLKDIGFAQEGENMEDYPMWLKITKKDIQLHLLDKVLVKYRIGNSLSKSDKKLINPALNRNVYKIKKNYLDKSNMSFFLRKLYGFDLFITKLKDNVTLKLFRNKKNKISTIFTYPLRFISPVCLMSKIKNKLYRI